MAVPAVVVVGAVHGVITGAHPSPGSDGAWHPQPGSMVQWLSVFTHTPVACTYHHVHVPAHPGCGCGGAPGGSGTQGICTALQKGSPVGAAQGQPATHPSASFFQNQPAALGQPTHSQPIAHGEGVVAVVLVSQSHVVLVAGSGVVVVVQSGGYDSLVPQ